MAYVLRELGDWDQAAELSRELGAGSARPDDALVADGILGSILAFRGDARAGRPLLARCLATSTRLDVVSMGVDSAAALGWSAAHAGDHAVAGEHSRAVLDRWERSEDHHYAVWGLRTGAWVFATGGDLARARACAEALSAIAADAGHPYALAALAHALGETALQEGDADAAARQFGRALELHADLDAPFERAQIAVRAGVALAAAGERELAAQRLEEAYRAARRLGSRPVANAAADELAAARRAARAPPGPPRRRRARGRGTVPPRARSDAPGLGRPHEPRDRPRALPQPPDRRHARPQHPGQAELPHPHRGREPRRRARPAGLTVRVAANAIVSLAPPPPLMPISSRCASRAINARPMPRPGLSVRGAIPDADVADDDDEFAVRAVDLDRQRAGRRSVAIGVHDDVRARLRDGEPDVVAQSRGESEGFGRLEDRPPDGAIWHSGIVKSRRAGVVGRETELERLGSFAAGLSPQALVLAGGPGFGRRRCGRPGSDSLESAACGWQPPARAGPRRSSRSRR